MPVSVFHAAIATTPDLAPTDPFYGEIRSSHWNDAHAVSLSVTAGTEIFGGFSNDPAFNVSFSTNAGGQVVASANVTAAPSPVNVSGANGSSVNAQSIVFSNLNGLSLNVSTAANGATITGSYTQSNQAFSAPGGSSTFQTLIFANSQGVSWSNSNGSVVASVKTDYLTTARASNDAVGLNTAQSNVTWTVNSAGLSLDARGYAGTGTSATNASITLNSNGLAISVAGQSIQSAVKAFGVSNTGNTAGNTGVSTGVDWVLAGSNNITASESTAGGGPNTVWLSGPTLTQYFSKTNTTFNGTNISGSLTLNTDGLRVDLSAAAAGGGGFTGGVSTGGNTAGNTGTQTGQFILVGSNNITASVGTAAGGAQTVTLSGPTLTQYFSKTNTTFNGANISGSITNNTDGLQLSLSVAAPGAAAENNAINLLGANTAGNTTATGSTIGWSGVNLTLSGTNNSQVVVSAPATSSLIGSSGISISTNGSTITVGQVVGSYYGNMEGEWPNSTTMQMLQSTSHIQPFVLENPISFGYIRIPMSLSVAPSSTAATTGNSSWSYGHTRSHNFVLYSRGVGASSLSLQSVASTQLTDQQSMRVSANANSTQFSYTNRATFQMSTGAVDYTYDYSSSAGSLNFHTSNMTAATGLKMMEFKWATSLAPGQYWMMYGVSSSTVSQHTNVGTKWFDIASVYGMSQPNLAFGTIGDATNSSIGPFFGQGSFTAGGAAGTTASLALSAVTTSASHNKMFFALVNIA